MSDRWLVKALCKADDVNLPRLRRKMDLWIQKEGVAENLDLIGLDSV